MQQMSKDYVGQKTYEWASERELVALKEENEGVIWNRMRVISERAFEARLRAVGV